MRTGSKTCSKLAPVLTLVFFPHSQAAGALGLAHLGDVLARQEHEAQGVLGAVGAMGSAGWSVGSEGFWFCECQMWGELAWGKKDNYLEPHTWIREGEDGGPNMVEENMSDPNGGPISGGTVSHLETDLKAVEKSGQMQKSGAGRSWSFWNSRARHEKAFSRDLGPSGSHV